MAENEQEPQVKQPKPVRFQIRWLNRAVAVTCTAVALIVGNLLIAPAYATAPCGTTVATFDIVLGLTTVAVMGFLAIRMLASGLLVSPEGLVLRRIQNRRHIDWSDIVEIKTEETGRYFKRHILTVETTDDFIEMPEIVGWPLAPKTMVGLDRMTAEVRSVWEAQTATLASQESTPEI